MEVALILAYPAYCAKKKSIRVPHTPSHFGVSSVLSSSYALTRRGATLCGGPYAQNTQPSEDRPVVHPCQPRHRQAARERYGNRLGELIETAIAEFLGREEERAKCRELTTAQTWHDTGVCTD